MLFCHTHLAHPFCETARKVDFIYTSVIPRKHHTMSASHSTIGVYLRTSTDEQEEGIESQLDSCRRKLDDDELQRVKLYRDEGVSGAKDDRQAFNELQSDIQAGEITKVVVSELSRISRNTLTLMEFLERVFDDEVGLVVADGQFPSFEEGNPFLEALARMMAVLAQLERDLIKARTQRGVRRAVEAGKWTKRPPKGFTTDDDGYLVVETEEYLTVVSALELVQLGEASIYEVSRAAGIAESTLRSIHNDVEKRDLYLRGDADDELKQEALDRSEVDPDSELSRIWNSQESLQDDVRELKDLVNRAIEEDAIPDSG